jgi:hypothetical protein
MVYAGRDPLTGKKKWVSRQIPGTGRAAHKEAKQIEARLLAEVAAGRHQDTHGVKIAELRRRGSKCQHCYRRMRRGEQPMRPGEVFHLAFTGKERVHETDCVQGIPMTASAIRDVDAVLSGALQQAVVWGWRTDNPPGWRTRRPWRRPRSRHPRPPRRPSSSRLPPPRTQSWACSSC